MKTPRQLLLQRHKDVEPRLDEVRQAALRAIGAAEPRPSLFLTLWRELILPSRRTWMGLGVAWVVILLLHLAAGPEPRLASAGTPVSSEAIAASLRSQQRLMAQLMNDENEAPKAAAPKPRSELIRPPFAG